MMHPTKPDHSSLCMAALGDWTKALHAKLSKPTCRPGWVYGPFPSPFSSGGNFDNLIAVATGIGITPALSAVTALGESRRVNLIWMCRDPDLVEYVRAPDSKSPSRSPLPRACPHSRESPRRVSLESRVEVQPRSSPDRAKIQPSPSSLARAVPRQHPV